MQNDRARYPYHIWVNWILGGEAALTPAIVDVIVANRITDDIRDVADKVYSRDLFGKD